MEKKVVVPTPKNVVEVLMKKRGEDKKTVASRTAGKTSREVTVLVYDCPKRELCKEGGSVSFEKGSDTQILFAN